MSFKDYYVIVSNMFIGFFLMIVGVDLLPTIAERSSEGSLVPFSFALATLISGTYFMVYKTFERIFK